MIGIAPRRLLDKILMDANGTNLPLELPRDIVEETMNLQELQASIDSMHKNMANRVSSRRKGAMEAQNRKTIIQQPKFSIGDLFLIRRREKSSNKIQFKWRGP